MLQAIKKTLVSRFFERHLQCDAENTLSFAQKQLAAAALLMEVAAADDVFDEVEFTAFKNIVEHTYNLSAEQIEELLILARKEQDNATSLHQFTHIINAHCVNNEKLLLIQSMWEIAYADGDLDKYEEALIRKIADLIYVTHTNFLIAKKLAKNKTL